MHSIRRMGVMTLIMAKNHYGTTGYTKTQLNRPWIGAQTVKAEQYSIPLSRL